jgi:hypothetical protein
MPDPALAARLAHVRSIVDQHQHAAGWDHPVEIVAVTKGHDAQAVRAAVAAGLVSVGENRVQEALTKQDACAGVAISWHLIGTLQRNKVRHVVGRFALIQSVDTVDLATTLDRRIGAVEGGRQPILIQVNCSREQQKGGVDPDHAEALVDAVLRLEHLELRGLMTLAALSTDVREQRRAFAMLRGLRDQLAARGHVLPTLSMGMSDDYPAAVDEGATMLRLGTALFGART